MLCNQSIHGRTYYFRIQCRYKNDKLFSWLNDFLEWGKKKCESLWREEIVHLDKNLKKKVNFHSNKNTNYTTSQATSTVTKTEQSHQSLKHTGTKMRAEETNRRKENEESRPSTCSTGLRPDRDLAGRGGGAQLSWLDSAISSRYHCSKSNLDRWGLLPSDWEEQHDRRRKEGKTD